jgi:hypothetical protein
VCRVFMAVEPETGEHVRCVSRSDERRRIGLYSCVKRETFSIRMPRTLCSCQRLTEKLEIHSTPTHGNWLTLAEIEISVLARQCVSDRFPGRGALTAAVDAWLQERNQAPVSITWRLTTADVRLTLTRLYPSYER